LVSDFYVCNIFFAFTQVTKYEVTIQNLEINIADWKVKVDKKTEEIESCQHENTANDKEIDTLKTELNDYKSQTSKLTSDLATCDSALLLVTNEYNEDEKRDHDEFVYRKKVENELEECEKRRDQLLIDFDTEKNNYANCKNEIVIIREENTKNSNKCQEDITNIKLTYQTTIDTCEASLLSEKDNYAQIVIQVTNMSNEITLIRNELNISVKVVEEWQKKHQYCEDGSKTLQETIVKLESNIDNLEGQLSTCIEHSGNTQTDLTKCVSDLDICSDDLTDSKNTNTENAELIIKLESNIKSVEAERDNCQSEITVLRCETNHILAVVDDAETKSLQALNDLKGIIEDSKNRVDQFVATQDIKCDTCSPDAPCIVN
jgi:chromosome segregation ATPase